MNELININLLRQALGIDNFVTKDDLAKALANVKSSSDYAGEQSSTIEKLQQQIDALKTQLSEANNNNEELQLQVEQKQSEYLQLNSNFSEKCKNLEGANTTINCLEVKVSELEKQLCSQSEELNSVKSQLKQKSMELESFDFQALYNQLSDADVRYGVSTYFNKNDNKAMVFGALTHCENFYRFVRNQITEEKTTDLPVLTELLNKVFGFFVSYKDYELIEPEIGMESNSEHSIILSRKMTGGMVSEVLLFGYKDNQGKVIQTALVKVQ